MPRGLWMPRYSQGNGAFPFLGWLIGNRQIPRTLKPTKNAASCSWLSAASLPFAEVRGASC